MTFNLFIRLIRAPFFSASVAAALLGNLAAFAVTGRLEWLPLVLSLVAILLIHCGANTSNELWDTVSGNDAVNQYSSVFNGGSRTLVTGEAKKSQAVTIIVISYLAAAGIGIYLWLSTPGNGILWLGLFGVLTSLGYTAPPTRFVYRGLGELVIALNFGLLPVLGGYYVQTGEFGPVALWAGLLAALPIAAVLYINEFPDVEADAAVGKRTLVVRLGTRRARWGYLAMLVLCFTGGVLLVALGELPPWCLLMLLTLPLAVKGLRGAWRYHAVPPAMIPAQAATVQLQLLQKLTLAAGLLITGLVL